MNSLAELPDWAALATTILLLAGAAAALIGSLGLWRLKTFYERLHAPTLGTTLGTGCIVLASIVYFSAAQGRPVLHEILIAVLVTVTTPITLMILVRAALFRDEGEGAQIGSEKETYHRPSRAASSLEVKCFRPPEAT